MYKWIKYIVYGFYFPIVLISDKIKIFTEKKRNEKAKKLLIKQKKKLEKKLARQRKEEIRVIEKAKIAEKKKRLRR